MSFYTSSLPAFCCIRKTDHFCDKMQNYIIMLLTVKMAAGLMCAGFEIFIVVPEESKPKQFHR